jgi:hypothetical protein
MQIDSRARAFLEANIEHYREFTLAVKGFEAEAESVLRSIWREFKEPLAAVGIREEDSSFKTALGDDASDMFLKSHATGIEIGFALQCRDADDNTGRFAVYSWVRDPDLRKSLNNYVATHLSDPFVHEYELSTTYITAYLDIASKSQAVDLLRNGFAMLIECLFGLPEFSKAYSLSGPAGKTIHHLENSSA